MLASWKTTLIGVLVGGAYALLTALQSGKMTLRDALVSAGFAALGILAKDFNVSTQK
jgi:gas vesicle protein